MSDPLSSRKQHSNRQKIRKWILIISFFLIPVTIFYISPIVILMGAAEGIATGSMLLFILLFLLSLFVARLWCGWLCPMGGWQEICSPVIRHTVREGWRNWIKYGVTALWLAVIAISVINAGGIHTVDPLYGTVNGLSITSLPVLIVVSVIFLIITVIAFIAGRRGFCHVFCPIAGIMVAGRKIRNLFNWPALHLDADPGRCVDCMKCSKECPMGLDVNRMVRDGRMENADCILCMTCVDTCPQGAVRSAWSGQ